jgi:hypothetical protein
MNKVQICRLMSGDIAVGAINEEGDLLKVMFLSIMPIPGSQNQLGINLVPPLAPFSDAPAVKIDKSQIVMSIDADDHLTQSYMEVVSGIIIPSRKDTLKLVKH